MSSVLLDVPAETIDELLLVLNEEAITYQVTDSRDGAIETVFTVEVTGSERQIAEAVHLLPLIGKKDYIFRMSSKKLAKISNVANNAGVKIEEISAALSVFGRTLFHSVKVSGTERNLANFRKIK